MARASSSLDPNLRGLAALAAIGLFLAALVLAAMIGTRDVFPGKAKRRARWCLVALLTLALALVFLSAESTPHSDF